MRLPSRVMVAATAVAIASVVVACQPRDPQVPWDTNQIVRELTADLRRFEGLKSDFDQAEVLAWQIEERAESPRRDGPAIIPRYPIHIVLLWARVRAADRPASWALVQGFRQPWRSDPVWTRSLFNRDLKAPLTRLRPGETADGTWHAFQRYDHPPSSREVCEFAEVNFLGDRPPFEYRTLAGAVRENAWLRVVAEKPLCTPGK